VSARGVLVRVDGSPAIGHGHVVRCLSLAEACRAQGTPVAFAMRDLPGGAASRVEAAGFPVFRLPEGTVLPEDATLTLARAREEGAAWIVVDHYALDARWEESVRAGARVLAIDDVPDRPHSCDAFLDQNLGARAGRAPAGSLLMLGPRFALLRPQFARERQPRTVAREVSRILVSFGGADTRDLTTRALRALRRVGYGGAVDVVLAGHPRPADVRAAAAALAGAVCHDHVEDMAALMAAADLALGAGGGTTWERCCLGVPALVVAAADNQVPVARAAAQAGAQVWLGTADELADDRLDAALLTLLHDPALRQHLADVGQALVDGQGAERVGRALQADALSLRRATIEDRESLFAWRNSEEVRARSFGSGTIAWADHVAWLERTLADPSRALLVGESEGAPVGVLRYDVRGDEAVVSIYMVPGRAGRGLGSRLLVHGTQWLRTAHPAVRRIRAEVQPDNAASRAAFLKAGYVESSHVFDLVV
jgi:UDP-2,4-diacetamido-2,4,6-trideoxy-beta-L-altropyranose hydrolase